MKIKIEIRRSGEFRVTDKLVGTVFGDMVKPLYEKQQGSPMTIVTRDSVFYQRYK